MIDQISLVEPKCTLMTPGETILTISDRLERAGRVCYQSKSKGKPEDFVKKLIKNNHLSVLEHESLTVELVCDRGISHELVRHRLASYSQESTRYCNYGGKPIEFILWPSTKLYLDNCSSDKKWAFIEYLQSTVKMYNDLLGSGLNPQIARGVLPHWLKTSIIMTANLREWRHVLKTRMAPDAHPDMRTLMLLVYQKFMNIASYNIFFEDLAYGY